MNIFGLIKDVNDAAELGKSIANADEWANVAQTTTKVGGLITIGLGAGHEFGVLPAVCDQSATVEAIQTAQCVPHDWVSMVASAIAILLFYVAHKLHTASNPNAGKRSG